MAAFRRFLPQREQVKNATRPYPLETELSYLLFELIKIEIVSQSKERLIGEERTRKGASFVHYDVSRTPRTIP